MQHYETVTTTLTDCLLQLLGVGEGGCRSAEDFGVFVWGFFLNNQMLTLSGSSE